MKNIMKNVIATGGYKLAEIQCKIKKLYIMGDLSEAEMDELLNLASVSVSTDAERPELLQMIQTLSDKITTLEDRVKALEGAPDESAQTDHPVWKPWDGISKDYQNGTVVAHNGQLWESVYDGQNVWEPGAAGQQFWIPFQN